MFADDPHLLREPDLPESELSIDRRIRLAYEAGQRVRSQTRWEVRQWASQARGELSYVNYVYVVLLNFPEHYDPFGLCVGRSHLRPPLRLANHRAGIQANQDVQRYGKRLLNWVYQHLNPMRPREAVQVEHRLFRVLHEADIGWVSMGRCRPPGEHLI